MDANEHATVLQNTDHDDYVCRSEYYCTLYDVANGVNYADGRTRCQRNLPRTHACTSDTNCASGSCYCGVCFESGAMKGGEICNDGSPLTGYNSAHCASGRCKDWIGADTLCSRVCYSSNAEPCEVRSIGSQDQWVGPGDHTHLAGAGRDTECLGPESGIELSCWENTCTDSPPLGASCYTDAACNQGNTPNVSPHLPAQCEQGFCTMAANIPGGAICREHTQCISGHCWEWYAL